MDSGTNLAVGFHTSQVILIQATVVQVFGQRILSGSDLFVSSTKGSTGHLLGAAGAVEAAFCTMAIQHGRCPPGTNLYEPDDPSLKGLLLHESTQELPDNAAVICNSFGFGGTNTCLVLSAIRE
jgi:3-oxoacyl-[acyl-carrier-protein] synthase II